MWVYGVKGKKLHTCDIHSFEELKKLRGTFDWMWIDCLETSSEEFNIISQLTKMETKILEDIKGGKIFPHYKKFNSYSLLSISYATMQKELKIYPIYIIVGQSIIFTLRTKESSTPIEHAIQALEDSLPEDSLEPSFILCEILRENANKNLDVVMTLRDIIEELEEKVMAKPSKKLMKEVFTLKKQMARFYRLLWNEQQMIASLKNGLIPNIELCEKSVLSLEDTCDNISRELEFLTSYDGALDGVLRLQDLSMIHRVERTLIYLTLIIVVMNLILILLELSIWKG
ncbi:MAG: CorA family divalent cation transporter [Candidatus Bathyarchaeia archaeon]